MNKATKAKLPKVKCRLVGEDGNAFAIMGRFKHAAERAGWHKDEIKKLLDEAMSGNYDHLLATISAHCARAFIPDRLTVLRDPAKFAAWCIMAVDSETNDEKAILHIEPFRVVSTVQRDAIDALLRGLLDGNINEMMEGDRADLVRALFPDDTR